MVGGVISVSVRSSQKGSVSVTDNDDFKVLDDEVSSAFTESIAEKRAGPGILILSTSGHLLYKDRRAWQLCAALDPSGEEESVKTLPLPVQELCGEINKLLQVRTDAKDWEQFRVKRVFEVSGQQLLLSGLGLPDRHGLQQSRILITVEEIGRRPGPSIEYLKDVFRLTDREIMVVQNLLKGWTNKEIANELKVTEQTIKEHIKHIMAKTKTTTRTGILVQVIRL
ncbi:MAG TPA: helix-turn-helix transcriptional regulator [Nitrospirales bacterium]|jgi:DNA-binding CsgD family transcriptional regulator